MNFPSRLELYWTTMTSEIENPNLYLLDCRKTRKIKEISIVETTYQEIVHIWWWLSHSLCKEKYTASPYTLLCNQRHCLRNKISISKHNSIDTHIADCKNYFCKHNPKVFFFFFNGIRWPLFSYLHQYLYFAEWGRTFLKKN